MGVDHRITVAPGVAREDGYRGYYLYGSKEALIASGHAKISWFTNGELDKRGRVMRTKTLTADNGRGVRTTSPAKGPCQVYVPYTEAEREAARIREELNRAKTEEKKRIDELPSTHEQFREDTARIVERFVNIVRGMLADGHGGYRFESEVLDAFDIATANILRAVAEGRSRFNPEARKARLAEIKAQTAKKDPGLQRFLNKVQEGLRKDGASPRGV